MELRQLKYFLKAKELLNFTEAAASLHISQSTLSQQIKQLEDDLKVPLFNRIGKRITLTEAGKLFSEYAQQTVSKANDGIMMLHDLHNLQTGDIAIGVTYGLRHLLTETLLLFTKENPRIKFYIVFGTSDELEEKLNNFELDCVLTFNDLTIHKNFRHHTLFSSPMALIANKTAEASFENTITLEEISKLPLVLPSRGYSTSNFIFNAFDKKRLTPDVSVEINDIPTLLALVRTGSWFTILTQTTVIDEKELITIPIEGENMIRTAMVLSLHDVYEKKSLRRFLDLLIEFSSSIHKNEM